VSSWLLGGLVGGAVALAASPYLARVSRTAPDRDDAGWWRGDAGWWRGVAPSRRRLAVTALVALALGGLAGYAAGWSAVLPAFLAFALLATPLVLVDVEHHRLPDRIMLPAAVSAVALLAVAAAVRDDWPGLGRAAAAGGVVLAVFGGIALASPSSMGLGDVKLAAVIAVYLGWLGWVHVLYGIFVGFVLGAVVAGVLLAARRASLKSNIALGPALIAGALLVAAVH
jgi:leader peptidase (prepilin peptidase)/N-methyltransferase